MPAHNRAHYTQTYATQSRKLKQRAYADPTTRCEAILEDGTTCGRTLSQHPPHKTGRAIRWTAGHVNDGEVNGALRPEASSCAASSGARLRNERTPMRTLTTTRDWLNP